MKTLIISLSIALFSTSCSAKQDTNDEKNGKDATAGENGKATAENDNAAAYEVVNHDAWDALLKKYVNDKGLVNYKGFTADSVKLNTYLKQLGDNPPLKDVWTREDQLAYWFNAYNAFTVQLIIRNYPLKSIKDIAGGIPFVNTPWDVKFIHIGDETYDLNNIEHGIVRKQFDEEKIHFALVCAAKGCPRLRNEAYTPDKVDAQLIDQAKNFFNSDKNKISADKAVISPLLDWYGKDFKDKAPSMREYINKYSEVKIKEGVKIGYGDYDWSLNEQS